VLARQLADARSWRTVRDGVEAPERDRRVGVPELARDEHGVQFFGDEQRGEPVAQRMEREPPLPLQARSLDGRAEPFARVALVAGLPVRVAEDELLNALVRRGQPALTEEAHHGRGSTMSRRPRTLARLRWFATPSLFPARAGKMLS
jgi:hypothetical protein